MTKYSGFQAKWCKTFVVLARLLSNSGCSNPYDNQVWSHTYQLLPIAAINTPVYGQRALGNTNFGLSKKLWYSMVSSTTSKPFCLLKHNGQQSRISNLTYLSNLTHWNCCLWSQDPWEHKSLLVKSDCLLIELMLSDWEMDNFSQYCCPNSVKPVNRQVMDVIDWALNVGEPKSIIFKK